MYLDICRVRNADLITLDPLSRVIEQNLYLNYLQHVMEHTLLMEK